VFADQLLHQHIFWHARWDKFKIKINMSTTEFDLENVIPVTEANLKDEQKQAIAKAMEDYKQQCLKSFSINRSSEVIQKEALPTPRQVTFDTNPGKLQDMVDSAINRALINQAGVLSNTVFNAVARTQRRTIATKLCGPCLSSTGITGSYSSIGCYSRCGHRNCCSSKHVRSY